MDQEKDTEEGKYKDILDSHAEQEYGDLYKQHILEIYKTYLETAEKISSRRQSANSYFLTINTAIIGIVGYVQLGNNSSRFYWFVGIAGILLCFTWYRLVRSYRDMNTGKFKVIHEIEKKLPISPLDSEWEVLGRGKDKTKYLQFTVIESRVPLIFAGIHFFVVVCSIPWHNLFDWISKLCGN
ncbi:MAG: hypothetical protein GY777_18350 [Candidatus Brocadiaceae bacterium]|nr:hypothetical protein [Candidatus Brocadiaceae bacterium]